MRSSAPNQQVIVADGQAELILELHRQFPTRNPNRRVATSDPAALRRTLMEFITMEGDMIAALKRGVVDYANSTMNPVGRGDHYTNAEANVGDTRTVAKARPDTKNERVAAVNLLLEMLKTGSSKEIYEYIKTPQFHQIAGLGGIKLTLWRKHLSSCINQFISGYEKLSSINTNEYLIRALADANAAIELTNDQWAMLFWSYNPKLIAKIIVEFHQIENFQSGANINSYINFEMLQRLLISDPEIVDQVNATRANAHASLMLPDDVLSPGKNTLREESLTPAQLYQYEGPVINAVENWLFKHYAHLLLNNIVNDSDDRRNLHPAAPYYFYLVPAAQYMLLDPDLPNNAISRYHQFKKDITDLLNSVSDDMQKPVILCGLINIDNVHYLPYFISKTPNGLVSVLTMDPSPRVYSDATIAANRNPVLVCSKLKMLAKIEKIFRDIFPRCEFRDPDIAQMLRERDCGPNSATTLQDAFETCMQERPLIEMRGGLLNVDVRQLSVNAASLGTNPYTKMLVYPVQLDERSLANRAIWAERLMQVRMSYPCTIRAGADEQTPLTITDVYIEEQQFQEEFNYLKCIDEQQQQDDHETKLSAIRALLMSSNEGKAVIDALVANYKNDLSAPSSLALVAFVRSKVTQDELVSLTERHAGNLELLCDEFVLMYLKDHFRDAFLQVYRSTVLTLLPAKLDLNADAIIAEFLLKHEALYKKLSIYQQREINSMMQAETHAVVINRLSAVHMLKFEGFYKISIRLILCNLPANIQLPFAPHIIHAVLDLNPEFIDSVSFLQIHNIDRLNRFIEDNTMAALRVVADATEQHMVDWFAEHCQTLESVLQFFDTNTAQPIKWDSQTFANMLPVSSPNILNKTHVNSFLGVRILDSVNYRLGVLAKNRLQSICDQSTQRFLDNPSVMMQLLFNQDVVSLTSHVHTNDEDAQLWEMEFVVHDLVKKFGGPETIREEDLNHNLVGSNIKVSLKRLISEVYKLKLAEEYQSIRQALLAHSSINTYGDFADKEIELALPELVLNYLIDAARQSNDALLSQPQFSCIFNPTENAATSAAFNRFQIWFVNDRQYNLFGSYERLSQLDERLTRLTAVVSNVNQLLTARGYLVQDNRLVRALSLLSACKAEVNSIQLQGNFDRAYAGLLRLISKELNEVVHCLASNKQLSYGEICPQSYTAIVRPVLCQLLGFQGLIVATQFTAKTIDNQIKELLKDPNPRVESLMDMAVTSTLLTLPDIKSAPDTHGKPITRDLILTCIAFWQANFSWKYVFKHADLWFDENPEPDFLRFLMRLVNDDAFEANGELSQGQALQLRGMVYRNTADDASRLDLFQATDISAQVRACLLKTSTMMNAKASAIKFSQLVKLFNLPVKAAVATQPAAPVAAAPVAKAYNQQQLDMKFMQLRQEFWRDNNPDKLPDLPKPDLPALLLQARNELSGMAGGQVALAPAAEPFIIYQVEATSLRRQNGFFSSSWFAERVSDIENVLLKIQQKHAPQADFNLDADDIDILRRALAKHWQDLSKQFGDDAYLKYVINPRRSEQTCIAIAELLAKFYRDNGQAEFVFTLLVPGCQNFGSVRQLKPALLEQGLPRSLAIALNGNDLGSTIDDIKFDELIITRSGCALQFSSILNLYQTENRLTNPYTNELYTVEELVDICRHPRILELAAIIRRNNVATLTPRAVNSLVAYLNKAIFDVGFNAYYDADQNNVAFQAVAEFTRDMAALPLSEKEALMNELIPLEGNKTVAMIFDESRNDCLTIRGAKLARIVLAYKGDEHGLVSEALVRKAKTKSDGHEVVIPRKQFAAEALALAGNIPELEAEQAILNFCENRMAAKGMRFK